jgi:hypothetical protein
MIDGPMIIYKHRNLREMRGPINVQNLDIL